MDALTVDRLFRTTKCVKLGTQDLVVHALSDLELQERHRRALEASMRLGRALKNTESGEYLAMLEPVATADVPVLVVVAENARRRQFMNEIEQEVPFTFQPFPEGATLEEQAEVLEARERAETELKAAREKRLEERLTAYRAELQALPEEKLRAEALRLTQNLNRDAAYSEEFVWQSVLLGTETPDGLPYFKTIEQARRADRKATDLLWSALEEVTNIDPLGLKSPS